MKILVPIKQVAQLDEEFELSDDGSGIDPDFVELELNEWDSFSTEAALRVGESAGEDFEVVVVTIGDEEAGEALRTVLAMGADRAIRVWDESLEQADPMQIARILAAVVEREQPDLVLAGVQSSDAAHGVTGIALAGFTGLTHVAVVRSLELDGGELKLERELEGGLIELLSVALPALITVQTGANDPRYANLRAIKQAGSKPMEELDPAALGLDADTLAAVRAASVSSHAKPEQGSRAEILDGDDVGRRLADIIRDRVAS